MKKILVSMMAVSILLAGCSKKVEEKKTLTVQFVPTNNDGTLDAKVKPFETYLSEKLGMDVKVTMATDYSTIVEAMVSNKVDLGIMPPAAYVQARNQKAAKAVLTSSLGDFDQATEQPLKGVMTNTFKGEVIVKADSDMTELKDLKGKKIATLSPTSASGYIYPVAELMDLGIDPTTDCTLVAVNDIPSEISAVLNGQVDAAFVFEGARFVFSSKFTSNDLFKDLKVLYLTKGDIPNDAIAVNTKLDEELANKIKDVFLNMSNDEAGKNAMSLWNHTGYIEVDEKAYDTIEEYMAKASK